MNIECPQCFLENLPGSSYCQECGSTLEVKESTKPSGPITKEIEEVSDVIFKPRSKSSRSTWLAILTSIIFVFFGLLLLLLLLPTSGDEEYVSNTTNEQRPVDFPISYLQITKPDIVYDNSDEPYFAGTLKNTYTEAVRNVKVRLDFYYDEALENYFDTRIVTINSGAESGGVFSFEVPLNFYPYDEFWWIWEIEGADYALQ